MAYYDLSSGQGDLVKPGVKLDVIKPHLFPGLSRK